MNTTENRSFYKTTLTIEILSENPIPGGMSLEQIAYECINGGWSMNVTEEKEEQLDGKQTAEALLNHGSDPEFFGIDADGNEIDY